MSRRSPTGALVASIGILAAVIGGAASCNQPPPPASDTGEPDGTNSDQTNPVPVTTADELLSLKSLPRFDLRVDPSAWDALLLEPKRWVVGDFEYGGVVYEDVGFRLKGNHSFRPIDDKPSWKIKFNRYQAEGTFLGLEGLTLNNMVVDTSMLREWVAYRIFRALDVPAPRVGYAQVWVNDEPYGLYLTIEPYDAQFLARFYDDGTGNLYESETAADLNLDIELWEQDEGSDKSRDDLVAFAELAQQTGDAVFYGENASVDMPRFLDFMFAETLVGHFDGHIAGHNFFLYHEPSLDLWTYHPWGLDQAFVRHNTPYEHQGFLGAKCLDEPRCLVDYVQTSQSALARLGELDLDAEVEQLIELTDDAMRADDRKPYSEDAVERWRNETLTYVAERNAELVPALDCLQDGSEPDADGDGFGPCFEDCDDDDPTRNPGAEEICDGIDNNCSGYADDAPACECPSIESEGRTYYLCSNHLRWIDAEDFCAEQGHVLARFDSSTQVDDVASAAKEVSSGRWAIGLNDREEENDYRWIDGSAPSFSDWADGEPAHVLEWFDCVFLHGDGDWHECNCIEVGAFVCSD